MFSLRRVALLLVLGSAMCTSTVFANKGPTQYIKFVNNSSVQVGVTPNGTNPAILSSLSNPTTAVANFTAAGGRILTPTGTTTFSVQVGTYTVLAADMTASSTGIGYITESVTVGANQTVTVTINDSFTGTSPPISF